jgi:rRNA maturation RNase YbeY
VNLVEVVNATRTQIDEELVARLVATVLEAEGAAGAEVAVEFVGEARIRALNREHRGRDEVTDVLSFPLEDWDEAGGAPDRTGPSGEGRTRSAASPSPDLGEVAAAVVAGEAGPPLMLGDIVVCTRRALRQARADSLPPALELAVLLAHGTLHLLGYDHETDAGRMALRQAAVLEIVEWEGLVVPASR